MPKYKAFNIKINIENLINTKPREAIISKLHLIENDVKNFAIIRESLDSRYHKSTGIFRVYTVTFDYPHTIKNTNVERCENKTDTKENAPIFFENNTFAKPVIVGSGPAGLFAALRLLEMNILPVILEQGKDIPERSADINTFFEQNTLNPMSNIQCGLGGAGTFSDGKLMSRIKNPLTQYVNDKLIEFGAPAAIKYQAKPHLGTDRLKTIIGNIKRYIEENGGSFLFSSEMSDICIKNGRIVSVIINDKDEIPCGDLLLAIGNASRKTFKMLYHKGLAIISKPFAVGVRVEHEQSVINKHIYGMYSEHKALPPAEYQLIYKDTQAMRSVYTFCNCPGGYVLNSSCENDTVSTNGMSFSKRHAHNANSAIVVTVKTDDFDKYPLSGIDFQRRIEEQAFKLGGGNYKAPVMNIDDFLSLSSNKHAMPSIKPGYNYCDISGCFPDFILCSLKNAITHFCSNFEGFISGVMTAPETRTSSPVRIIRNAQTYMSATIEGIYPIGEGAGYAGGIMSSAVDGAEAANKIAIRYRKGFKEE